LLADLSAFARSSADKKIAHEFEGHLLADARAFRRDFFEDGHFTGSAWVASADGERVLLTLHRKLGRWLQLGGHADGDTDLARVALREATEESGLDGLAIERTIFDLDKHLIPAHGDEPAHFHYDVRFVVSASADETYEISSESIELRWWPVAVVIRTELADPSLKRMAAKWLDREAANPSQVATAKTT
jgi:8-oxo-dGTP pyrophosphatase MutT (NUDIX family)